MCSVNGCEGNIYLKGMCCAHYQRNNRYGSTDLRGRGAKSTHGMRGTPTYKSWQHMKYRCLNDKCKSYKNYGGRGISVCEKWMDFQGFFDDMGIKPEGTTIDRIDVNGNYTPENCRWATNKEQSNNKRNNNIIEYNGIKMNNSQWADALSIPRNTLHDRINKLGWPAGLALGFPDASACRAIVAAHLGDTVQIPDELAERVGQ